MHKKAAISGGVAAVVLGGGLALALTGGGSASAARTPARAHTAAHAAAASPAMTAISRSQAETLALKAVGGGQVRSAELEDEHGVAAWSVKVIKSGVTHDVHVDARTGKVRDRVRRDDDRRDRAREAERRHEPEARHDRAREDERRHGGDDAVEGHRHRGGDDHGGHGGGHSGPGR